MLLKINEKDICHDGDLGIFTEMPILGVTDDKYEVCVNYNDGGKIPHFHYRKPGDWRAFHTCIEIGKAKYFRHGNKQYSLSSRQKKELIKFLKSKPEDEEYNSNWEKAVDLWNKNNSDIKVDKNTDMPNYNLL